MNATATIIKILCFFLLFIVLCSQLTHAQDTYKIEGNLEGYEQASIFLAYYFADKQYLLDTSLVENGSFLFTGRDSLNPGVYLIIMPPENKYFQIVVNNPHPNISISANCAALQRTLRFEGSTDNTLFYENLRYVASMSVKADSLAQLMKVVETEDVRTNIQKLLSELDNEVKTYQRTLTENHPTMLTSALVKSGFRTETPTFKGTAEEIQNGKYRFYKEHYFDYVDLGDERLIHCPPDVMYDRVINYLDKLTPKQPDSIINSIDYLLAQLEPSKLAYRTFLIKFLNDYASSKIIGMDAVYVHLVDKYYSQGKAPWIDKAQLAKIIGNARAAKPTLIGKIAPDFIIQLKDSSDIRLHDIQSPYVVLIFWAHDCPHCKESMPEISRFQEDFHDQGVVVFSVCTKVLKDEPKCWDFVMNRGIENLINTSDMKGGRSLVRTLYNVRKTPKLFVLDHEKHILIKDLNVAQLYEYFEKKVGQEKGG